MATMAIPSFHTISVIAHLLVSHYSMRTIGLYTPIATTPKALPIIPTPRNILDHVARSGCESLVTLPTFLQIWSQDNDAIDVLAKLDFVASVIFP